MTGPELAAKVHVTREAVDLIAGELAEAEAAPRNLVDAAGKPYVAGGRNAIYFRQTLKRWAPLGPAVLPGAGQLRRHRLVVRAGDHAGDRARSDRGGG